MLPHYKSFFNQIVIRQESLEGILTTEEAREAVQSFLADVNILVLAHLEPDLERQWHTRPPHPFMANAIKNFLFLEYFPFMFPIL